MTEPSVTIQQGTLRGSIATDVQGSNYYSFQGIPFAKPPLGNLRFKAPQPPDKWDGIWDATKERSGSYGRHLFKLNIIGSEDCLHLNVFTKTLPKSNKSNFKPVLVWIHGGGLIFGPSCGDTYRPDFLITQDVVIVTVCYRLGLLGFLSLDDSSLGVPGNAGYKDMVMALKWVQFNIAQFNGDPNNVTIFGESAGAASVHLLVLSPMTKGLIHKAIIQSGSALHTWSKGRNLAQDLSKLLGFENADEKTVLEKLTKLSVEEIFEIQEKLPNSFLPGDHHDIGYVIETGKAAFLSEQPLGIIKTGNFNKIPLIFGCTSAEGIFFDYLRSQLPQFNVGEDFEVNVPHWLGYKRGSNENKAVAEKIRQFYYSDKEETHEKWIALISDNFIAHLTYVSMRNHARFSDAPVYYYKMSIETGLNFLKVLFKTKVPGASHCDDLGYLFKNFTTPEILPGSPEDVGMKRFVKLWTNFALYGNPTPQPHDSLLNVVWRPVERDAINFLDIGESLSAGVNPDGERMKFWDEIFVSSPLTSKYIVN